MAALTPAPRYRGRFAPSPTGPLHFGSLVAALASRADALAAGGEWLLRIEDVDTPRSRPGAADAIVAALARCGFAWDGPIVRQSERTALYEAALARLVTTGQAYPCACSRRELATAPPGAGGEPVYPGTCRGGSAPTRAARAQRAWRVRVDAGPVHEPPGPGVGAAERDSEAVPMPGSGGGAGTPHDPPGPGAGAIVTCEDRLLGRQRQDLARDVGDFVVRRADGLFAYQLAVVVDDALQGVTDVVRGADLAASTPRQVHLQRLLGYPTPRYLHVPVAVDASGAKLSKQTRAAPLPPDPLPALLAAWRFLGQALPVGSTRPASVAEFWAWARSAWNPAQIPRVAALAAPAVARGGSAPPV